MQNLRVLVCPPCYDKPQQNGQRTYILPQDPVPVLNARPEFYVPDNNPYSGVGAAPIPQLWQYGSQIGTMVNYAGVPSAFDGNVNKPMAQSAVILTPHSSFNNFVGINWQGNTFSLNAPSSLQYPVVTHSITAFTITAPNDATLGATAFVVQGSPVNPAPFGAWTTLYSGNPQGVAGETISGQTTGGQYQFHRVAFWGGSGNPIAVAQVQLSVGETYGNSGEL